jgi:hypothetical protein
MPKNSTAMSLPCFENSENVEVPAGTGTNSFWPGKRHERGSFPVTNTSFSVHEHGSPFFILYPLSFILLYFPCQIRPIRTPGSRPLTAPGADSDASY